MSTFYFMKLRSYLLDIFPRNRSEKFCSLDTRISLKTQSFPYLDQISGSPNSSNCANNFDSCRDSNYLLSVTFIRILLKTSLRISVENCLPLVLRFPEKQQSVVWIRILNAQKAQNVFKFETAWYSTSRCSLTTIWEDFLHHCPKRQYFSFREFQFKKMLLLFLSLEFW